MENSACKYREKNFTNTIFEAMRRKIEKALKKYSPTGKLKLTKLILFAATLMLAFFDAGAQQMPLGYQEYFKHACNKTDLFNSLSADDSASWMVIAEKPANVLRIRSEDSTANAYPSSRAMFFKWIWGDYILSFKFRHVSADTIDSPGFTFLGAARNAVTYYAFGFSDDSLEFFYINGDRVEKIKSLSVNIRKNAWNSVVVQRDILNRSFSFTLNNASESSSFSHPDLVMGYIGFGNDSGTSYLRDIKLWAPTVISETLFEW